MKKQDTRIAYFSSEIGISSSLPTYSGGLGVLAGDHIKASTDADLSMVGISLLYKEGYFKQKLDEKGKQIETYPRFDLSLKLKQLPNKFKLHLRERDVWIGVYEYLHKGEGGQITPIYFLDTDLEENITEDRIISLRLYSGDKNHRILQEALLGFGGVCLLEILGYKNIETYHMNEGHCSFLTLALLKKFNGDEDKVRSACHFTTHTPVEAGHDHFSIDRCREILHSLLPNNLKLPRWIQNNRLHMTELGLYFSRSANGVSELHGKVARDQFPHFSIDHITNGIYHPYWLGESFQELFDSKIPGWRTEPSFLLNLNDITDDELNMAHSFQKNTLLEYANKQSNFFLSNDILTIGFARRAAEYKRARLIFSNPDRLAELGKNKIQIIFAGKAHPKDDRGKNIIQGIFEDADKLIESVKIIFLENYNMQLGHIITSGVDVWLNTPLRPNEASGTSGMKAALNGVPNLSTLDGWWAEGYKHDENGWAIGTANFCDDQSDAESLYELLENKVIPTFYNDNKKWMQMMRSSIQTSVDFTAYRMIAEYQKNFYQIKEKKTLDPIK
jgi:starch phosphorylase